MVGFNPNEIKEQERFQHQIMMTQTHMLLAAAIYTRPGDRLQSSMAIFGGFFPDMALTVLFVIARLRGVSAEEIFGTLFWSESWSLIMAPGNSFVIFVPLALSGLWLYRQGGKFARLGWLMSVFGISALLHLVTDFFLHVDDARAQFWPVSDWIFRSPVSYWDSRYYGSWVQPMEFLLAMACIAILFRRYAGRGVRILLSFVLILYIALPIYFYFNHQGM